MHRAEADRFPLRPGLVMLNHAAFGLATTAMLDRAEAVRRELETDPLGMLDTALPARLDAALDAVAGWLGLDPERCALTANATAGAAAVTRSLPLGPGDVVVLPQTEYPSMLRGWEVRCAEAGARLVTVDLGLPVASPDDVVARLDALPVDEVAVLHCSVVASATAVHLPVPALAAWARSRGARLVLDAAHVPGHVPTVDWVEADVVFGTLHKWLPAPRAVGMLWVRDDETTPIRPAEVSLTWDDPRLTERFAWPGTFDPTPRLCLPDAIAEWTAWREDGLLERAEAMADDLAETLIAAGGQLTAGPELEAPRLRAFLLTGVAPDRARAALAEADIVAPVIDTGDGSCLVRAATHVYTDHDDVAALAGVVRRLVRRTDRP